MLSAGTRIGPFEVISLLGAGGMGEVYRARDTSLNRDVALKVLPEALANDPDRYARFTREAQTLASLNHPLIAHVHGLESSSGIRALVMELVEGEDLAQRLERGALSLDEALPIAKQMAEALEAAHEQGIVHRDLKPANIKIKPDSTIKILDFGLAKAMSPDDSAAKASAGSLTHSPTLTFAATQAGMILGTASYMSPEQARGRTVDRRTDIWAFGCVFYEMLTGRRAFTGEDVSEIAAAVIKEEPRWNAVPPQALKLIKKCLQKDPRRRLRDIGDAWDLWDEADPAAATVAAHAPVRSRHVAVAWSVAGALALLLGALAAVHFRERPPVAETMLFQVPPPSNLPISSMAISPDGRHVAFIARKPDSRQALWVRSLDSLDSRVVYEVSGTSAVLPFWSPNSTSIAFGTSAGELKRVNVAGGPAETVCIYLGAFRGGAWSSTGSIVFGTGQSRGLQAVPASGGTPQPVTRRDLTGPRQYDGFPAFLHDGSRFIYFRDSNQSQQRGIYMGSLGTPAEQQPSKRIFESDAPVVFASSGPSAPSYLLFRRERSLLAQPFLEDSLEISGSPVRVVEDVPVEALGQFTGLYSASSTGVLVHATGTSTVARSRLTWYTRQGAPAGEIGPPSNYGSVQLSSGGKYLSTSFSPAPGMASHVSVAEVARGIFDRLNPGDPIDSSSLVDRDGRVAFTLATEDSPGEIHARTINSVGQSERWVASKFVLHANGFSHDGRFLIYDEHHATQRQNLWIVSTTGEHKPIEFSVTAADETLGQFSPDDQWIAYASDETGRFEVFVQRFAPDKTPASDGRKWKISSNGGDKPRWSNDGKELFYISPDRKLIAVPVRGNAAGFERGNPVELFDMPPVVAYVPYDVAADGKFLFIVPDDSAASLLPVTVVLNWQRLLDK